MSTPTVVDHPLLQHKLSLMRCKETDTPRFRHLMREASCLIGYEVTRDLTREARTVETPLAAAEASFLADEKPVLIPILRAGNGMLDLLPTASVGYLGLRRDPGTLTPSEYYFNAPGDLDDRLVVVLDPTLATAGSATAAVSRLKAAGARRIRMVCLLTCAEGIQAFHAAHPDVPLYTAALEEGVDSHGYLLPGVGDVGDRLHGTT
ncbi:MAG: uracil phosphoribosyltransferase [Gammaproteobacteria bacterium]|nr:uracil phosphoribosyltransferase [Gammaproteobacteria bacterium]